MSEHILVKTQEQWDDAMAHIGGKDTLCMDTETDGVVWYENEVCSVQIGTGERSYYFPFRHKEGENLDEGKLRHLATEVLHPDRPQTGFHYTFDVKIMEKEGMKTPRKMRDPMLSAHLLNENEDTFRMEDLAVQYLGEEYGAPSDNLITHIMERFDVPEKGAKGYIHKLSAEAVMQYGLQDIDTTWELDKFHLPHLEHWGLAEIACEVNDFALALCDMEKRGIPISQSRLTALGEKAKPLADKLEAELQALAREDMGDPEFPANPRSHPQMKMWLGQVLGVPSTGKAILMQTGPDPRAKLLLDYRQWHKLKSSFVDPYWGFIGPDGRIHPGLFITTPGTRADNSIRGASSSRLSSAYPNLQQVPEAAKHLFESDDPDYVIAEFDYSQAELRLNAHYWAERFGDLSLGRVLLSGEDVHGKVAEAFGIPRKKAKIRNFAIEYGAGARLLAEMNQTTVADERRYLRTYQDTYPGSKLLLNQAQFEAEQREYIRLWTGRVAHFNHVRAKTFNAKNKLIQGGVAEMLRRAITKIAKDVPEAQMILTVHDSIVFMIPRDTLVENCSKIRCIMQDQPWCTLPMVVDVSYGPDWGNMIELPRSAEGIPAAVMEFVTDPSLLCG